MCGEKEYDYGIALLRLMMCFGVVCIHYWWKRSYFLGSGIIEYLMQFSVSIFMILSFMLEQHNFSHGRAWLQTRLTRLLIPQVGWTIIYWMTYSLFDLLFGTEFVQPLDFLWQLFLGHSPRVNTAMWFQVVLIWLTILFYVIVNVFSSKRVRTILIMLSILVMIFEMAGGLALFDSMRYEIKYPVSRMISMILFAAVGYLFSDFHLQRIIKSHRMLAGGLSILVIFVDVQFGIYKIMPRLSTTGVPVCIVAVSIIVLVQCIPFERINNNIKSFLNVITKYTLGIYCIHNLVGTILISIINHWKLPVETYVFWECIVIYIVSYLLSAFGFYLFKKTRLRMMFN